MNQLKIKKLHEDAITPTRSFPTDSGLDLYTLEDMTFLDGETKLIKTGIAVDIPAGYEGQVRPRSGLTLKSDLRVHLGTIDASYRGDVGIITTWSIPTDPVFTGTSYTVKAGTKIAQLVVAPVALPNVEVVDNFDTESARGENGFGSTDR